MSNSVKPIPEGYHTVTPYLTVKGGAKALEFYKKAFGAQELYRHEMPDGKIMHAKFKIGDSILLLSDEFPESEGCGTGAPDQTCSVLLYLYVPNVDTFFQQAVNAGAKVIMPVADMFWGDRYGQIRDPFGHCWSVATHKENVSKEELEERALKCFVEDNSSRC